PLRRARQTARSKREECRTCAPEAPSAPSYVRVRQLWSSGRERRRAETTTPTSRAATKQIRLRTPACFRLACSASSPPHRRRDRPTRTGLGNCADRSTRERPRVHRLSSASSAALRLGTHHPCLAL